MKTLPPHVLHLTPKFELTEKEIQYLLYVEILPFCKIVQTKSGPVIIAEDPSDDMFLRCCDISNAKVLISGDSHLLALKSYGNASILTPSQFLTEFSGLEFLAGAYKC